VDFDALDVVAAHGLGGTVGALLEDPTVYENLVQFLEGARRSYLLRSLIRSTIESGSQAGSGASGR